MKNDSELSPELKHVAREGGTEPAFTGKYVDNHEKGMFKCAICGAELFSSDTKFDSGTGWPSFSSPINADTLAYRYNPDVFIDDQGIKRCLEPAEKISQKLTGRPNFQECPWPMRGIVEKSNHVRNVKASIKEVEPYLPR